MTEAEKKILDQEKAAKEKLKAEESRIKEDIARKSKPTCTVCGRFLFESPRCTGHGGGGGGGGGSSGDGSKNEAKQTMTVSAKPFGEMDANITGDTVVNTYGSLVTTDKAMPSQQDSYEIKFNLTSIAQLLANNDLTIENDKQNGCLTVSIEQKAFQQMSPKERMEFKEFINFIEQQFNDFKNNLNPVDQNGCFCKTVNPPNDLAIAPSIQINIDPDLVGLYDKFIQHLTSAIKGLTNKNNAKSIELITTHLQDPFEVTDAMKKNAKSEHQDFLDQTQNTSPEAKHEGRKRKMTPFQTELTRDGIKKYREDKN